MKNRQRSWISTSEKLEEGGNNECSDGPESPQYRKSATNMWIDPVGFHNYYLKIKDGEQVHPEIQIK